MNPSLTLRSIRPVAALSLALSPALSFAGIANLFDAGSLVYTIILRLSQLFWVIAIVFFLWGVVKFIANASDTKEREQGKSFMVWGIISFLVLVSIWGLVRILVVDTFGITPTGSPQFIDKNGTVVP